MTLKFVYTNRVAIKKSACRIVRNKNKAIYKYFKIANKCAFQCFLYSFSQKPYFYSMSLDENISYYDTKYNETAVYYIYTFDLF